MTLTVTPEWLFKNKNSEGLVMLDASLPAAVDGTQSDLHLKTIAGSRKMDLELAFSDRESRFPNTVPTPEQFQLSCKKLGINNSSRIVVFDNMGVYSSPRAWWLFCLMGHDDVVILDGGLPAWVEHGFPIVDTIDEEYSEGDFAAHLNPDMIKLYEDIRANVESKSFTIVDARSEGRFNGTKPEPRKHLKSGHIPHSVNVPYAQVLENGQFKNPKELKKLFEPIMGTDKNPVFSCGSGLTACIIMMAYGLSGGESSTIYDGSWTEWAELENLRVED